MTLYDPDYRRRRDALVAWAYSHPTTATCWQCGQTLATCGPNRNGRHRNGRRAKWTGGHTIDGDPTAPLALECSPCNFRRGAQAGNRSRGSADRRQPSRGRGVRISRPPLTPLTPRPSRSL